MFMMNRGKRVFQPVVNKEQAAQNQPAHKTDQQENRNPENSDVLE